MVYIVYCEFYGKKLKIAVTAESAVAAKKVVRSNLKIIKIIKDEPVTANDLFNNLMDILGMEK